VNCEQCSELLADYIDGALSTEQRAEVDAHLATCKDCGETLDACNALPGLLRRATDVAMPADVKARLRQFLAQRTR
jgi:anti-sigma factor (TIGR02949 family)